MPAPTFVTSANSTFADSTTPKTFSVTTQAGDIVVVFGGTETNATTLNTPSGNSISFSLQTSDGITGNYCPTYIWAGTDNSGGTNWTLSVSRTGTAAQWTCSYAIFRNSAGLGNSHHVGTSGSNTNPYLNLTASGSNSAILTFVTDWDATNGSTRTWQTVNSVTPTSGNGYEILYNFSSGHYTGYAAYYPDAGSSGSKTVGLSNLTGHAYAVTALEILGSAGTYTSMPWLRF